MKRIPTTLAAVAAAAVVAAAITIPAVAQSGGGGASPDPGLAQFTACLTAHGVAVPAGLGGVELKQWIGTRVDDPTIAAALNACAGPDHGEKIAQLRACLSSHGVDVTGGPDALKRKMLELSRTDAGRAVLNACDAEPAKPDAAKPAPGDCGGGTPAPTEAPKQQGT
jgi:hypothetical protein